MAHRRNPAFSVARIGPGPSCALTRGSVDGAKLDIELALEGIVSLYVRLQAGQVVGGRLSPQGR